MAWGLEQLHNLLGNQTIADAGNAAVEAGTEYAQQNPWTALGVTIASAAVVTLSTWYTCCRGRAKSAPTHQSREHELQLDETAEDQLEEGADNKEGKRKTM